jgi:hypothetical protein
MTTYPFKQGLDYGLRKGTLGLAFHMSEGRDGLVNYLARHTGETNAEWSKRIRGVSANACILSDGTVWNMVAWHHASGSMNPADRNNATSGYYNGTVIKAVLGSHFVDPNAWSISCEIAGFRAEGPTAKQVAAAVAWGEDMKSRFSTLRGAYGHHDQTDTKGCPGTTANMKRIFEELGGHGLWRDIASDTTGEPDVATGFDFRPDTKLGTVTVNGPGHFYRDLNGVLVGPIDPAKFGTHVALGPVNLVPPIPGGPAGADRTTGVVVGNRSAHLLIADVVFKEGALPNCDAAVNAALDTLATALAKARPGA